ncbi:TerC family protein [Methylocapsa aurea]|uniref:TerC family protein n=1 Tax=Methylocapsa aurea TaxID=663610 RepID=UPI00056AAC10|nr:TerC family protein [Methylocapsa aurea]
MNPEATAFLIPLLQIIWIDILLSGDNAVVIALACRSLPRRQRQVAILLGAGAAVMLRVIFTSLVVEALAVPYLKIVGGALLLWIAIQLVAEQRPGKEVTPAETIWASIRIIVVADAVMSLDNVVAIASAAKGSKWLILFGLALSIPLIVFGSTLVLSLLTRFPALVWFGAALLGWIAGDVIGSDPDVEAWLRRYAPSIKDWGAPAGAFFVLAIAGLRANRASGRRA